MEEKDYLTDEFAQELIKLGNQKIDKKDREIIIETCNEMVEIPKEMLMPEEKSFYYIERLNSQGKSECFSAINEAKTQKEEECWLEVSSLKSIMEKTLDDNLSELVANFDSKEKILKILEGIKKESKDTLEYESIKKSMEELKSMPNYTWEPIYPTDEPGFELGEHCNSPDLFGTVTEAFAKIQELWQEMDENKIEYNIQDYYLIKITRNDQPLMPQCVNKIKIEQSEIAALLETERMAVKKQYEDQGIRRSFKKKNLPPIEGTGSYSHRGPRESFKEKFQN